MVRIVPAVVALLAGCSEDLRPSDRGWSSEHFRYHARDAERAVCEGVTGTLEDHYDSMRDALVFPWPREAAVDYYKYVSAADLRRNGNCTGANVSCYLGAGGIETADGMEEHELVHAYLGYLGDSHPALEEGVAEALSCGHQQRPRPAVTDLGELFEPSSWRGADASRLRDLYDTASWFVGYLLHTGTADQFIELYDVLAPGDGVQSVEIAFERVYGRSLEENWRTAMSVENPEIACYRIWECSAPAWQDDPLDEWGQACDQSDRHRRLTLGEASLVTQTSPGSGLRLASCDYHRRVPHDALLDPLVGGNLGERMFVALPPGEYFASASPLLAGQATLDVAPVGDSVGLDDACGALTALSLQGAGDATFALDRDAVEGARESGEMVMTVDFSGDSAATYGLTCSEGGSFRLCPSCDVETCVDVCTKEIPNAALDGRLVLRVKASEDSSLAWLRLVKLF